MNHSFESPKIVQLQGKKVVFKKGHPSKIFQRLNKRKNIKSLIINTETLELHDPLTLHQTNIVINAKEIHFFNKAQISTTPISLLKRSPNQHAKHGLNGGSITILTKQIFSENQTIPLFITNGGDGQGALLGSKGKNGVDGYTQPHLGYHAYSYYKHGCFKSDRWRQDLKSTKSCSETSFEGHPSSNGENATAGGFQGIGGNAGLISINDNIQVLFNSNGGITGSHGGNFKGGSAGKPVKSCSIHKEEDWGPNASEPKISLNCQSSKNGLDANSPIALISKGKSQTIKAIDGTWVTNSILEIQISYIKALVANRHFEDAKHEFDKLSEYIMEARNTVSYESSIQLEFEELKEYFSIYPMIKV